jgi:hypothetical protein
MPPPPKGCCHFPVNKNGRQVWCGRPVSVIDPNTGELMLWCAEHAVKLAKIQKKIRRGEMRHLEKKLAVGSIHMF